MWQIFRIFLVITNWKIFVEANKTLTFPENFRFGVATSAYQIEGAWNVSDKGESVWDNYVHTQNYQIHDGSTGDESCDSYHNYKRDVEMLVELGVDFYRFSISWSRLLPTGYSNHISRDGLNYYNNLIDEVIKYNITPMVTLMHWDTPQVFQKMGTWTNVLMVDYFEDYARVLFENFGDRVKEWITFNEPQVMCAFGYGQSDKSHGFAPNVQLHGVGEYLCVHNTILAHARVYHLYNDSFKPEQNGKIGIANYLAWMEPESNSTEDAEIAEKGMEFVVGWVSNPIYSKEGDYPSIMRDAINKSSHLQGLTKSRLPKFTEEEINYVKGTFDFMGLNYYTSFAARNNGKKPNAYVPSFDDDFGYDLYTNKKYPNVDIDWDISPSRGFRRALNWAKRKYGNHEIFVLENGFLMPSDLDDKKRIQILKKYLTSLLNAIQDGCNISLYTAWSLMDNFEWVSGYMSSFGFFAVDFTNPNKTRTPRLSVKFYKELIRSKQLNIDG